MKSINMSEHITYKDRCKYNNKNEFKSMIWELDSVDIYKEVIKGKYLTRFPAHFWEKPNSLQYAKDITKYLIEKKIKLSDNQLKDQLSFELFKDNKLSGMIVTLFKGSPYLIIENAYPGKFKPWEFNSTIKNNWNLETAKEATKWLIEEKLKLSDDEVREQLSYKLFKDNKLGGMTAALFKQSPYLTIENAYPGKFKSWEFNSTTIKYWNLETAKEATKWLIEEKLKLSDDQIKDQLSFKLFKDNKLSGMLGILFNHSPYLALENTYPGKFKKSDFKNSTHSKNYNSINGGK